MITASLVLYKSKPSDVERVLESVERSIINHVYVVDNSPSDELKSIVVTKFSKVEYIYGQGNVGYGEGNNIGLRKAMNADATYHVILNPDIIFEPTVIKTLTDFMDSHVDVGVIKPEQKNPNSDFNTAAKLLPTPFITFGRRFFPASWVARINNRYEMREVDLSVPRNVPNLSGSFLLLRVTTLKSVGLFDKRFFMYFEDFDLVRRFHKISKTLFYPHVVITHAHGAEHQHNNKLLLMALKSGILYYNKWGWFFDHERRIWNKEALSDKALYES